MGSVHILATTWCYNNSMNHVRLLNVFSRSDRYDVERKYLAEVRHHVSFEDDTDKNCVAGCEARVVSNDELPNGRILLDAVWSNGQADPFDTTLPKWRTSRVEEGNFDWKRQ